MKKHQVVAWILLVFPVLTALACGNGPLAVGGPTPEYPTVAVSTESAGSLVDKLSALNAATGEVTVSITETELTSFMADKLTSVPDATFSDPQVFLRDGKIKMYATVTTSNFTANALIVLNTVVVDGKVTTTIERADFGPIPAPTRLLDSLTETINDDLLSLMDKLPAGVQLKSIAIADGVMTLTANVK